MPIVMGCLFCVGAYYPDFTVSVVVIYSSYYFLGVGGGRGIMVVLAACYLRVLLVYAL